MASAEADVAARLIERLLADPAFRARFRRDPAGACREAGLDDLAEEMSLGAGKAMYTLDVRESKSSLAGVMMAAAMEGVGIYQFSENVLPHLEEVPGHIADVLSRVDLPAIKLPNFDGAPGGGGSGAAAAAVDAPATGPDGLPTAGDAVAGADAGAGGGGGAADAAAQAPPPPPPAAPPESAAAVKEAAAEKAAKADAKAAAPPEAQNAAGQEAAKKIAEANSPEAAEQQKVDQAAADLESQDTNLPSASDLPTEPPSSESTLPTGDPAAPADAVPPTASDLPDAPPGDAGSAPPPAAPAPAASDLPSAPAPPAAAPEAASFVPDPKMFGAEGSGGPLSPEATAVLKDSNITLDGNGKQDFESGKMDPRVAAVILKLAEKHKLTITSTFSDHPVDTAGGSVSNHTLGRGLDIGAIDGKPVNADNPLARDLASELTELDPSIRPTEVGTPFPISDPAFFTDADHQDHIHIAFDDPISKDFKSPPGLLSGDGAAPPEATAPPEAAAAAAVPAAPAAVAPAPPAAPAVAATAEAPPKPKHGSQGFLKAVTAEAAAKDRAKAGDSQAFLKAVEPPKAQAAAAPAQPGTPLQAAAAAVDLSGAPGAYPGDNAPREQIAAWMAAEAQKRGLPPQLPVMASLVESGMKNLNFGDADSVGFFQMRVGIWNQGDYAGFPDKPELQVKWFLDNAEQVKKQRIAAGQSIDDPKQFGNWIADVERPAEQYRGRYQLKLDEANGLLKAAPPPAAVPAVAEQAAAAVAPAGGGGSSLGAAALSVAQSQKGVREVGGANVGPQVDQYLAAAKVAPGNPWCASFVTWSLEQAGHKMPGGGWAAVATWVQNAEQGKNGLKVVSAEDARPGDIVAYDWGGGTDFGSDGHIGFLDSNVQGGKFTALEGNNNDAVSVVPRQLGGANIKFIRIEGNAAPGAGAPAVADQVAAAPAGGGGVAHAVNAAQFGAEGTGGAPDPEALALLKNKNVVLDDTGVADIKAGRIDPRVVAVITKLSHEHKITISCMCSDHSQFTAGGSVSNHHFGRGADIAAIDGQPVGPGNPVAREVASELSSLDPSIRPNEIGSPWAIAGPGYFTDAAHQNHLHIGFKEAIGSSFTPPADVAASPVAAVPGAPAAAAAAVPGAPPAGPAPEIKHGSQAFMKAVTAEAASKQRAKAGDSQAFLKAVEPPKAQAAAAQAPAPAAAEAAAAAFSAAPGGIPPYPGDNAPQEQIAAWMAAQAQARGLPPELPIMASMVESGMKNLHFGDADSVGFYQMRVSIWEKEYPGYQDKPELQVKWFLDQAEAVKKQRLAAGKSVDDPNQYGDWIADVERPAEQYRGRYALKLGDAQSLLKSAPAAAPVAPAAPEAALPVDPGAAPASAAAVADAGLPPEVAKPVADAIAAGAAPGPQALKAIEEASKYVGTQYHWGGSTPQTGFDCSGLMQWSYAQSGIQMPRVTYDQIDATNATAVEQVDQLRPGDLVFFASAGDVHHVGMYLGDHEFLHAPHTGDVVKVSSLDEPYYKEQFAGGRRFDQAAGVAAAPPAAGAPQAVAAAAPAPPAAPAPDPNAVAQAQAHVAREAADARRNSSQIFMAITAQEARKAKHASVMFLKAVQPEQVKAAAAAPPAAAPPAAAAAVPPPAPVPESPPAAAPPEAAAATPPEAPAPAAAAPPEAAAPKGAGVSVDLSDAATAYPGDNASQKELAKWLAGQAQKAGLPPELPVMASLVESGVKNLNFGDADSVGFFQMRVGIWNKGAYAGYPEKPELQAKWFIDQALAVKRKAITGGDANFGKDPAKFGEWIANVERPAEQFRGRYQLRLGEARKLLS